MGRILNAPGVATRVTINAIRKALRAAGNPDHAVHLTRFFKTGAGEYGEGDRFLGIRVPAVREIVREYAELSHDDTLLLLQSQWHEERLTALLLLEQAHASGDATLRKKIFDAYLANTQFINNWDLVDASAGPIAGPHLNHTKPSTLSRLAHSPDLWEKRIAIVSTFYHIKQNEFDSTLLVAGWLLNDTHDLIHMLSVPIRHSRESGNPLSVVAKENMDPRFREDDGRVVIPPKAGIHSPSHQQAAAPASISRCLARSCSTSVSCPARPAP